MPMIANLGAGSIAPLQKHELANIDEFRNWDIVNLDIYNQIVVYSPDRTKIPFPDASIAYSDVERQISLADQSVDIALAVSPYGYSVINSEVYRILKPQGVILIMGSQRNKYVNKLDFVCSDLLRPRYFELFEDVPVNDLALRCITFLAERGSSVSSGAAQTKIDLVRLIRKR